MSAPAVVHHTVSGGGAAAASPNASASEWFDADGFDQTDGFGDERGDLARNVRPKIDSGAYTECVFRSCTLSLLCHLGHVVLILGLLSDLGGGAAAVPVHDGDFTKQLLREMEQQAQ